MTRLTRRHKLLGGFCGIVATAWGIDLLTGGAKPREANAIPTTATATEPLVMPPDPADLPGIVDSLSRPPAVRAALEIDPDLRDPFTSSARILATLPAMSEQAEAKGTAKDDAAQPVAVPFEQRHVLQGVMEGRVPLALIDGTLYRRGALIDGYRLERIERDHVILKQGASLVTLAVPTDERP